MRALVETRQRELQAALAETDGPRRSDIESALNALTAITTGDLDHIPGVVVRALSQWIATSRYLGATETRAGVATEKAAADASLLAATTGRAAMIAPLKEALSGDLSELPEALALELIAFVQTSAYFGAFEKTHRSGMARKEHSMSER